MATMIGVRPLGDRKVSVDEFPIPAPPPGDVLIRIRGSGVCGSDLHVYRHKPAEILDRRQIILGHEPAGEVTAVGPGVRDVAVGDRVAVYHHAGCGTCPQCQAYRIQYCPRLRVFGRTEHGSDAEYMLAPALHCHQAPATVTFEDAALVACIAGTGFSALRQLNVSAVDSVGVYGLGPVGLVTALLAKALGARVIGTEVSAGRRELARRLGVDAVIDPQEDGVAAVVEASRGGVAKAVECSGQAESQANAIRQAAPLGAVVYLGIGGPPFQIDAGTLIGKQLRLIGSWVQEPHEMDELFRFMVERGVSYAPMITHRFPLREAQAAFDTAGGRAGGRVMFTFD